MWLDMLSIFLQRLLEIVLPVLASALAGVLVAWLMKIVNDYKTKLSERQAWVVEQIIDTAVYAAEQVKLKDIAIDKKNYALGIAEKWLLEKGIKMDFGKLDALIEAAVYTNLNQYKVRSSE